MNIISVKTEIIHAKTNEITQVLSAALPKLPENSVVAITSKIVSLCEGNYVNSVYADRDMLIESEAELFLPKSENKYQVYLTIKNGIMIPNAGIDESNTGGYYVKWPQNPYISAKKCREFLQKQFGLQNVGVIITDSVPTPLKWGVTGICIGHAGFHAVNDKVNTKDLFGRTLEMTRINVADALAAAAVLCMGEADEQTPLAVLSDLPFVRFADNVPDGESLTQGSIDPSDDLYGPLLTAARWNRKK